MSSRANAVKSTSSRIIIGGSNAGSIGPKIARACKISYSPLIVKKFPDGELYVRFRADVSGKTVILVQSMHPNPNDSLIETVLAIRTAQELGAKKTILVAPYLGYLRQDKRFNPGECVSNKIIADLLSCADLVITVDPHLHRIQSLDDIFEKQTLALSANADIAQWILKNKPGAIILGPDSESFQWADVIAKQTGLQSVVLHKKRYSSRNIRTQLSEDIDFRGKDIVIVDDIISTGHTMIEPIKQLKQKKVKSITCICVHGLFVEGAIEKLRALKVTVIATNTIDSKASAINLATLIAHNL